MRMNASTGIGPTRSMRSRSTASSGFASGLSSALDIGRRRSTLVGCADHQNADQNHRQGIEDPGGEGTDREDVTSVRLAEELAERSRQAIADERGAGDHAGSAQR